MRGEAGHPDGWRIEREEAGLAPHPISSEKSFHSVCQSKEVHESVASS
jgi:hypothetical protein